MNAPNDGQDVWYPGTLYGYMVSGEAELLSLALSVNEHHHGVTLFVSFPYNERRIAVSYHANASHLIDENREHEL